MRHEHRSKTCENINNNPSLGACASIRPPRIARTRQQRKRKGFSALPSNPQAIVAKEITEQFVRTGEKGPILEKSLQKERI